MAGSASNNPLTRTSTSTPPTDTLFHSSVSGVDPPYSAPNPANNLSHGHSTAATPRLPVPPPPPPPLPPRLGGSFLGGGPVTLNGTSAVSGGITSSAGGSSSGSSSSSLLTSSSATGTINECKMVELHGLKVASFHVNGLELICLPQVFDLFLKHLVGGLHTVYTKLKRLDICPVVCTVEQVRVLRGLGAIQPGVNRCKLITRKDFEALYNDCTNASSRPGRPPKRALGVVASMDGSRLLPHGLLSPALLSPTGLTAAAMAEAVKIQKMRMMMGFQGNSDHQRQHNGTESENDDINSNTGGSECSWEKEQRLLSPPPPSSGISGATHSSVSSTTAAMLGVQSHHLNTLHQHNQLLANRLSDLPFMVMPHPLLPVGLPPASVAMAMNQMSQLSSFANMAAVSSHVQAQSGASVIKESIADSPSPCPSPSDDELRPQQTASQSPSRASSSSSSSTPQTHTPDLNDVQLPLPLLKPTYEKLPLTSQPLSINHASPAFAPFLLAEGLSSMETLLTNIQGLLKVAVENARVQEKHSQNERKELKLELYREREIRENLERQLNTELHSRVSIQRRLRREKKAKRKLQEALDFEARRREQVERALKQASGSPGEDDAVHPENEVENNANQQENSVAQENSRPYSKPPILF